MNIKSNSSQQPNKIQYYITQIRLIMELTDKENEIASEIYLALKLHLRDSQQRFPLYENVIAIYFPQLIKFFSGILLRSGEIDRQTDWPIHPAIKLGKTEKWPYVLYNELENGFNINQFNWGHQFAVGWKLKLKRLASLVSFYKKQKLSLSFTRDAASLKMINLAIKNKMNFNILALDSHSKVPVPNLEEQLFLLERVFKQLSDIIHQPENWRRFHIIFTNHIRADCEEGNLHNQKIGDILIAGSGPEIENRLLSSLAGRKKSQIVNLFHGGSYWVQDKPAFKEGEKLLCTDYFAYGATPCQEPGLKRNLFQGSFEKTNKLINTADISSLNKNCRFMYVPTSLAGKSKRHGPFESLADSFYCLIQEYTLFLFGDNLIVKVHPKNNLETFASANMETRTFEKCLDLADAFIFDYHSTAFNIAAATNKPIIYFDYGVQNFKRSALKAIKARTVYFNMKSRIPKSFEEIIANGSTAKFDNTFAKNFSSKLGQPTLADVLFNEIRNRVR